MENYNVTVIKKDGTKEDFNPDKIISAVEKSAYRALSPLTDIDKKNILEYVNDYILNYDRDEITVPQMHNLVESALERIKPEVAKSYRDYRNYKTDFVEMLNSVYKKAQSIMYIGDKENSNTDSALVSTKRSLIYNQLNKELYQKFFMTVEELQACRDGYIYIHDMSARRDTMNCFHKDTRFITSEGVKSFADYNDGDEITVLTHKGNWKKAVVKSYGHQPLQKISFKCKESDPLSDPVYVYATKNHRWILNDGSETTDLKIGDKLINTPNVPVSNSDYTERFSFHGGMTWFVENIESIKHSLENPHNEVLFKVWCLEVEDDHSFVLEGGIPTGNCCIFDIKTVLTDGFEMGNVWYNEPKSLNTAFDVIGDVTFAAASQQYGN